MNDRDIEEQIKNVLLRFFFILSLSYHLVLLFIFIYLRIQVLWIFNIFSCSLFAFNFYLLHKKKYLLSLQLAVFEICTHSLVATYMLGWNSYFGLFLVSITVVIINSYSLKLFWKYLEVISASILFIVIFLLTGKGFKVYTINPIILEIIGFSNLVMVLFSFVFMSFRNFKENNVLKERLKDMAEMDTLTNTYNRRFFNKYLDIEIRRNTSQVKYKLWKEGNFGIAMLDVDNFKRINDLYGHLTGDRVLIDIAGIIKTALFERDILCRYGGEEFVILFTATSREGSIRAIEKIRKLLEDHQFYINSKNSAIQITASIGFASFDEESDIYKLLNLADNRLYKAKKAGKNRVVFD